MAACAEAFVFGGKVGGSATATAELVFLDDANGPLLARGKAGDADIGSAAPELPEFAELPEPREGG